MPRTLRWFVIGLAMLIATVSTWAFMVNLLGPLAAPEFAIDSASADPTRPKWNFFGPFEQWDDNAPASARGAAAETYLPPWWYITARAADPYWVPWLAGPLGTFGFGTLALTALGLIVLITRTPRVKP